MTILIEQELSGTQKEAIFHLWNAEYPAVIQLPALEDLDRYLAQQMPKYHLFLADDQGAVMGWLFLFEREEETWFAMILDRAVQGQGHGTSLLKEAGRLIAIMNGWAIDTDEYFKADGSPYRSPLNFYRRTGFVVLENRLTQPFSAVKVRWERNSL